MHHHGGGHHRPRRHVTLPGMEQDQYDVADRRREVAELARQRLSLRRIARALGVSHETIRRDLAALAEQATRTETPAPGSLERDQQMLRLMEDLPAPPPNDGAANLAAYRAHHDTAPPQPEFPRCQLCGQPHPGAHPRRRGLRETYAQSVLPDPGRPPPIGRTADDQTLVRDQSSVW
jgi:DNA-binding CsgD family transcriptional regulator